MHENGDDLSFRGLFVPFTAKRAVLWLIAIGVAVFFNALFGSFVWDDKTYFIDNPLFQNLRFFQLFQSNGFNTSGQYRPIPAVYFWTLYSLFKTGPFFYHVASLIIHIANAILLFFLLKRFFRTGLSFFLAAVFLVHPMQVESVSFIAAAGNPLFFLFGIGALLLSLDEKTGWKKVFIICSLLLLSLLSKETGGLFLILIVARRFLTGKKDAWRFAVYTGVTLFAYAAIRFTMGGRGTHLTYLDYNPISRLPYSGRLLNIPPVLFYYLKTFVYPARLIAEQMWAIKSPSLGGFYVPLFAVAVLFSALTAAAFVLFRKRSGWLPAYLLFALWFVSGLVMHSQIFPLDMTVADRWFYFPLAGLLGLTGIFLQRLNIPARLSIGLGTIVLVLFSVRTAVRNANWSDPIALYTHDLKLQENFDMETYLGVEYGNAGEHQKALGHFRKSVALFPHETNIYDLGVAYARLGNDDRAVSYFRQALAARNYNFTTGRHRHNLVTYQNLIWFLIRQKSYREAQEIIGEAFTDYPDNVAVLEEQAILYYRTGKQKEAETTLEKAVSLRPYEEFVLLLSLMKSRKPLELQKFPTNFIEESIQ